MGRLGVWRCRLRRLRCLGRVLGVVMDTKISGEGGMILGKCLWCLCEDSDGYG
jgi:hypothetical protein